MLLKQTSHEHPPSSPPVTTHAGTKGGGLSVEIVDVILEFIECIIHHVLYIREVYPPELFERVTAHTIPTFKCTHPVVCDYVGRVLEAMRPLFMKNHVDKVVVCPCKATLDHTPLESFTLGFKTIVPHQDNDPNNTSSTLNTPRDTLSQFLRTFLLKLCIAESLLLPIPPDLDITFYVMLQLGNNYMEDVEQDRIGVGEGCKLPWIQAEGAMQNAFEDTVLIPLKSAQSEAIQLQLYVQERRDLKCIK